MKLFIFVCICIISTNVFGENNWSHITDRNCEKDIYDAVELLYRIKEKIIINRHYNKSNDVLIAYREPKHDTDDWYSCKAVLVSEDNDMTEILYGRYTNNKIGVEYTDIIK